jgi:predicted 2-oxoglutarate/Fe(II)-dependent dioxygenase YbiX
MRHDRESAGGPDGDAPDAAFQALVRERYAGNPQALTELGARLLVGRDAPQSAVDGAALIAEAARQGDREAWRYAALLAAAGVGRPQSWPDAFEALGRAAALDDGDAARQIARLCAMGVPNAAHVPAWLAAPSGRTVSESPRLVAYPEFLDADTCAGFIERGTPKLVPARVNDARGGGLKLDPMRTNTAAVFSLVDTDVVMQLVRARIAAVAHVAADALEPPEILHYNVGETYRPHVDFFHPKLPQFADEMRTKGQRIRTCLVYLNDDFDGGETEFARIGIKFRGRRGEALVFHNVTSNGAGDMKTLHTGLPPTRGEKWLLSQWIRSKPQRVA